MREELVEGFFIDYAGERGGMAGGADVELDAEAQRGTEIVEGEIDVGIRASTVEVIAAQDVCGGDCALFVDLRGGGCKVVEGDGRDGAVMGDVECERSEDGLVELEE